MIARDSSRWLLKQAQVVYQFGVKDRRNDWEESKTGFVEFAQFYSICILSKL